MTDLKSGYLLGAHPRRQFLAQAIGVIAGTLATVVGFHLLVPDASVLTGAGSGAPTFAAPSAQTWLAVAQLFQHGVGSLHPMARHGMAWGLLAGALLSALEIALPRRRRWIPSPIGLGLGFILPFFNPFSMLLGAVGAWLWARRNYAHAERYVVPVSSGIIAGESIVSVAIALFGPLVDRVSFGRLGRRRPYILFAEVGMASPAPVFVGQGKACLLQDFEVAVKSSRGLLFL